jgi:hypothetical protein
MIKFYWPAFLGGLDELPTIRNISLGRALRVAVGSPGETTVSDPLVTGVTISPAAWITGLFVDTSPEARVAPTVEFDERESPRAPG